MIRRSDLLVATVLFAIASEANAEGFSSSHLSTDETVFACLARAERALHSYAEDYDIHSIGEGNTAVYGYDMNATGDDVTMICTK